MCLNPRVVWIKSSLPIECGIDEEFRKKFTKPLMNFKPGYYPVEVPCNECPECIFARANDWATRAWCEYQHWESGIFLTLTYNQKHLPINENNLATLRKKDVTLFIKRLRKKFKGIKSWENPKTGKIENPIRIIEAGEYGPKGGRPHYHICIFNWKPNDAKFYKYSKSKNGMEFPLYTSKTINELWTDKTIKGDFAAQWRGFATFGELTYRTACYTARYTQKKLKKNKKNTIYRKKDICIYDKKQQKWIMKTKIIRKNKKQTEYINASRCPGIGYLYWLENKTKIKENSGIWINDGKAKLKPIPRYFKKIWNDEDWENYEKWKYENKKLMETEIKKQLDEVIAELNDFDKLKLIRKRRERKYELIIQILNRNKIE